MSKTQKKVAKRISDAARRSETVHRNRSDVEVDDAPIENVADVIYLEKSPNGDGVIAKCTCGEWSYGPRASLLNLGHQAKLHAEETGHELRTHDE